MLSESDDDLIYMGMDTGDSADVDTANDVIIIDEEDAKKVTKVTEMKKEDKQKPAQQQKQEASKKTDEQPQLKYKNKVKENIHKQYNTGRNKPFHKCNHFSNFSDKE